MDVGGSIFAAWGVEPVGFAVVWPVLIQVGDDSAWESTLVGVIQVLSSLPSSIPSWSDYVTCFIFLMLPVTHSLGDACKDEH